MQNFSTASEATATALDSAGSAAKENERYMESLNAKTQQLKATFQDLANNVISNELVGAILDLADGFLKLANTDLGTFVTQMLLLTSVGWGATTLLQVSKLIPTVVSQFSNFATVLSYTVGGAGTLTESLAVLAGGGSALAGAFASALPVILAVSAAIAGIALVAPEVSKWWKELTGDTEYYTEKVQEATTELEQNRIKLEQLTSIPESDRTTAIQNEIDALKERNAELEKEISNRQQIINQNNLDDVREKYGEDKVTSYQIGGTGLYINDFDNFNDAVEKANELLKENGIQLKDMEGNLVDVADKLEPANIEYLNSAEAIQKNIEEFEELNNKIENNQSLTADEKARYSELIEVLKNYSSDLQNCGVDVSDLNDIEQNQIKTINELTGEYNSNVSSLYNLASVAGDGTTAIDGLSYSLALATSGIGLQKGQVDALSSAYPGLQFQIDETTGLYKLEQEALINLAAAGDQWAIDMISQQKSVTQAVYEELLKRKEFYYAELQLRGEQGDAEGYLKALKSFNEAASTLGKLKNTLDNPDSFNYTSTGSSVSFDTSSAGGTSSSKQTDPIAEQNELFEEQLAILEDRLSILQESNAPIDEQIALLKEMQDTVHEQAEWYRSKGVDENSEYLRELGQQWWQYYNQIIELQKEALDNDLSLLDDKAWFIEQNLTQEESLNKQSLQDYVNLQNQRIEIFRQAQEKIHALAEAYRAQGLSEDSEQLRELGKLWWDYENQITDINESVINSQEEVLQSQVEVYEKLFSYISNQISKEIESLQEKRDEEEKYWDDKIQALEDQNDEIERQIELEELQDQLARAKQTRVMVYKDGRFQYVGDIDEVSESQKNLEDYEREEALRKETENLEKLKEEALAAIDEQIDGWEEYKEQWSSVVDDYEEEQDRLLLEQELGIKLEGDLWKDRLSNLSEYVEEYKQLMEELADAQNQINVDTGSSSSSSGSSGSSSGGGIYPVGPGDAGGVINNDGSWSPFPGGPVYKNGEAVKKFAGGTLSAPGGLSLVGENGPELRILGNQDGIIPSEITSNLWNWGKIDPTNLIRSFGDAVSITIQNFAPNLSNVTDGESFANYMKNNFWRETIQFAKR